MASPQSDSLSPSAQDDTTPIVAQSSVKVAVNIRPLIKHEIANGCRECVAAVFGEPQVQVAPLGTAFTFDHVYGGGGPPMQRLFDECVQPLVDGLFHGYNATVLAYGQTGSGKTFTMGTGYSNGTLDEGVTPKVMRRLFQRMERLNDKSRTTIRVSLIEVHREDIKDLLDVSMESNSFGASSPSFTYSGLKKGALPQPSEKQPIAIRELPSGVSLVGVTEMEVHSLQDMMACLENGLLFRSTGSHLMNARSSRSHAIFTITVEQQKWNTENGAQNEPGEYLCAKMHLVDLAGSERIKRTKAEGLRMKEGIHINKGLLALGNVISSLGDEKKRREGGHVPYRDSKLTRLLQDSLGGNSRTVMIACVSPADSNLEETLNTLKYANRARNIENKPMVNRVGDQPSAELQRLRLQLQMLQAEVACARGGGQPLASLEDVPALKQKVAFLEATNAKFRQGLVESREAQASSAQQVTELQERNVKLVAELALARETARDEAQEELEEKAQIIAQLQAQLEAIQTEAKAETNKVKVADANLHAQFSVLRENAREEAQNLWRTEAQLRAELASVQEEKRIEAKKALEAEMAEMQLRLQLKSSKEQIEMEEKKVIAAENAGKALQEELVALKERVETERRELREENGRLKISLSAAQESQRDERDRAEKAMTENRHLGARLEESEARLQVEIKRAMDAQAAALASQTTIVQLSSQWMGSRESVGKEVEISNRHLQTNLASAQELAQVEATKALEAQTSAAQLRAELAAAQEMVRREEERREEIQITLMREQGRVVDSQEKAAEAMAKAREVEGSLIAVQESLRRADGELQHAKGRLAEEEGRRRDADMVIMQLRTELAVTQEVSRGASQNYQDAYANFLAESKKVFDLQTKVGELSSELAANKERLLSAMSSSNSANASLAEAHLGANIAQERYQIIAEKCAQAEAAASYLRNEVTLARETAKQEAMKAAKVQGEILELTRDLGIAEERAREAGLKVNQLMVERDAFREAAFAGHTPDDRIRQILSGNRGGHLFLPNLHDDFSSRSSFMGSSLDEDEYVQLEAKTGQTERWNAAVSIQTWWRTWRERGVHERKSGAAVVIQRCWRRYLQRKKTSEERRQSQSLAKLNIAVSKPAVESSQFQVTKSEKSSDNRGPIVNWGFLALDSPRIRESQNGGETAHLWEPVENESNEEVSLKSNGFSLPDYGSVESLGEGDFGKLETAGLVDEEVDSYVVVNGDQVSGDNSSDEEEDGEEEEEEEDEESDEKEGEEGEDVNPNKNHQSPSSVLETEDSSFVDLPSSSEPNSTSTAITTNGSVDDQVVRYRKQPHPSYAKMKSTPILAPLSEEEEFNISRGTPPKLKGNRRMPNMFRSKKQGRTTNGSPNQDGASSDPLLSGKRSLSARYSPQRSSSQRPFLSSRGFLRSPTDQVDDPSFSFDSHVSNPSSPSRGFGLERDPFWGQNRASTLGFSLSSPIGSESSRVWGSAALGLHGAPVGPATPMASPVRGKRMETQFNLSQKSAMAREKLAWEPYVFNRGHIASLKRSNSIPLLSKLT